MMKKWEIVEKLLHNQEKADRWIRGLHSDICDAFFDNAFVNILYENQNMLFQSVFNDYEYGELEWLMHEWFYNRDLTAVMDNVEYKLNTIEEAVEFYKKFHPE